MRHIKMDNHQVECVVFCLFSYLRVLYLKIKRLMIGLFQMVRKIKTVTVSCLLYQVLCTYQCFPHSDTVLDTVGNYTYSQSVKWLVLYCLQPQMMELVLSCTISHFLFQSLLSPARAHDRVSCRSYSCQYYCQNFLPLLGSEINLAEFHMCY